MVLRRPRALVAMALAVALASCARQPRARPVPRTSARALHVHAVPAPVASADAGVASREERPTALPVVACRTTFGIDGETMGKYALQLVAKVPQALANRFTFYTDGRTFLLAPTGWACKAQVGADGTERLAVSPATPAVDGPAPAIVADLSSACQGCAQDIACSLFPAADIVVPTCDTKSPPAEEVTRLHPTVAAFADPPRVKGTGEPSGGALPANGVVIFLPHTADGAWAAKETCTLPASDHAVCTAILDDFLARETVAAAR